MRPNSKEKTKLAKGLILQPGQSFEHDSWSSHKDTKQMVNDILFPYKIQKNASAMHQVAKVTTKISQGLFLLSRQSFEHDRWSSRVDMNLSLRSHISPI